MITTMNRNYVNYLLKIEKLAKQVINDPTLHKKYKYDLKKLIETKYAKD